MLSNIFCIILVLGHEVDWTVFICMHIYHWALKSDQQQGYDFVCRGHNHFITGEGGRGKTYLLRRILTNLGERKKRRFHNLYY